MNTLYPSGTKAAHEHLPRHVNVPSYSTQGVSYLNDRELQTCECGRYKWTKTCNKHRNLAASGCPNLYIEQAAPGLMSDGRRVLQLMQIEKEYYTRTWGFDAGTWFHAVCFDGESFYLDSTHASGKLRPKIRKMRGWDKWEDHLPPARFEIHPPVFNQPTRR